VIDVAGGVCCSRGDGAPEQDRLACAAVRTVSPTGRTASLTVRRLLTTDC
jgi:hypothetical protein